jgi:hypothetical protein
MAISRMSLIAILTVVASTDAIYGQQQAPSRNMWNPNDYVVTRGIRMIEGSVPIEFADNGQVQIRLWSPEDTGHLMTVEAAGFTTMSEPAGITITAIGPAVLRYLPRPRGDVIGKQSGWTQRTQEFALKLPREDNHEGQMRVRVH